MEKLHNNMAKKRLCLAWLRNLLDEATKSSELIGEGVGGGVVKVESRKWEVRIRSSIFTLQKSTIDFDFSICELTFYFVNSHLIFDFDVSLRRSTFGFDFLLSMATLDHGSRVPPLRNLGFNGGTLSMAFVMSLGRCTKKNSNKIPARQNKLFWQWK